jgi:hypothetical protein
VNKLATQVRNSKVLIKFDGLDSLIQDILDGKMSQLQFFVIPDWPCMTWYNRLHQTVTAEAVPLPRELDLFLDDKGRNLGLFGLDHWLFSIEKNTDEETWCTWCTGGGMLDLGSQTCLFSLFLLVRYLNKFYIPFLISRQFYYEFCYEKKYNF